MFIFEDLNILILFWHFTSKLKKERTFTKLHVSEIKILINGSEKSIKSCDVI